jgi:hypothetical protein
MVRLDLGVGVERQDGLARYLGLALANMVRPEEELAVQVGDVDRV